MTQPNMLERYWQGLGMALLLAGILFLFENANTQDVLLGRVLERLDNIEETLVQGVDDRYRGKDAARDFASRDRQISELQDENKNHEMRLDVLERMIYSIKSDSTPDNL